MPLETLIKSVFVASANDACVAIAEHICGSKEEFVNKMNKRAKELNLSDTHFKNPHGLDEDGHYSCAYDLAVISKNLMKYNIEKYTTIWQDTIRNGTFTLSNTNKLIRFMPEATGLKTGSTNKAGYCISATARKGNTELIAVVLGSSKSSKRFEDAKTLLNYGFSNYKILNLINKETKIDNCNVFYGKKNRLSLYPKEDLNKLIKIGDNENITTKIEKNDLFAPVKKGNVVGKINFVCDGKVIASTPLIAGENIDKKTYLDVLREFVQS